MDFHLSLSDSKSFQVSRTLLSMLAVHNDTVVWMVSTPTSKSSSPFNNPLVTVPKAPIKIVIIVTFMFHFFLSSPLQVTYPSFHILSVYCCCQQRQQSRQFCKFSFFFWLIIKRSVLLAEINWSVCMSKSHWSLCESFSRTTAGLWIYHLFVRSNLNFLRIYLLITLTTQSCLVLYYFRANLLHSLITWLMVPSLSPHSLHFLFCCVLLLLLLLLLLLFNL